MLAQDAGGAALSRGQLSHHLHRPTGRTAVASRCGRLSCGAQTRRRPRVVQLARRGEICGAAQRTRDIGPRRLGTCFESLNAMQPMPRAFVGGFHAPPNAPSARCQDRLAPGRMEFCGRNQCHRTTSGFSASNRHRCAVAIFLHATPLLELQRRRDSNASKIRCSGPHSSRR